MIFDEDIFPFEHRYKYYVEPYSTPLLQAWQSAPAVSHQLPTAYVPPRPPVIPPQEQTEEPDESKDHVRDISPSKQAEDVLYLSSCSNSGSNSSYEHSSSKWHNKTNPRYALVTSHVIPTIPQTTAAALKHEGWKNSMTEEMDAQVKNGTMSLVPRRDDMNVLGSRWIHTVKLNPDGTMLKLKSRLVAKGYEQEQGVDFIETSSPVVRTSTIHVVLRISVAKDWKIR